MMKRVRLYERGPCGDEARARLLISGESREIVALSAAYDPASDRCEWTSTVRPKGYIEPRADQAHEHRVDPDEGAV
jgi:hypothetical protein